MNPMSKLTARLLPALLLSTTLGMGGVALADTTQESTAAVDREAAWQRFLEEEEVQEASNEVEADVLTSGVSNSTLGGLLAVMFGGFGVLTVMGAKGKVPQLASLIGKKIGNQDTTLDDVQVVAIRSLGNNNALAVVEVFEQRLVLGVSQGQVSLLTRIDEAGNINETSIDHNTPNDFGSVLGTMMAPVSVAQSNDNEANQALQNAWNERQMAPALPTVPKADAINRGPQNLANQAIKEDTFIPMATAAPEVGNGQSLDEVLQAVLKARRAKGAMDTAPEVKAKEASTISAGYGPRGIPNTPVATSSRDDRRPVGSATRSPSPKSPPKSQGPVQRPPRPAWSQSEANRSRQTSERGAADQVIRRLQTMRRFR